MQVSYTNHHLSIIINGMLQLHIPDAAELIFQSWHDHINDVYVIEYTTKKGISIKTEYIKKKHWKIILKQLTNIFYKIN